jgi:hypothetical protein
MLKKFAPAALLITGVCLATCVFAQKNASLKQGAASWQAGETANVELSVRNNDAGVGKYDALFVVKGPNGKEYKAERHAEGAGDAKVFFPEDFYEVAPPSGTYTWECLVKDEVVVRGRFEYKQNNGVTGATADLEKIVFKSRLTRKARGRGL